MKTLIVPGYRRVRICYENAKGEHTNRYVHVYQTLSDQDEDLRRKASEIYRARWGDRHRIVSIDLHAR